jgi:hypothetical protein
VGKGLPPALGSTGKAAFEDAAGGTKGAALRIETRGGVGRRRGRGSRSSLNEGILQELQDAVLLCFANQKFIYAYFCHEEKVDIHANKEHSEVCTIP